MKSFGAKLKGLVSSGPSSVDLNFETARKEYTTLNETITKTYESLLKHDKNLQKTFIHPSSLNKNVQKYFPSSHPLTQYTAEVNKTIEASFNEWTQSQKANYDYIQQYLARSKFIKDAISDRDKLLEEVDKSASKIKSLKEKPSKEIHKLQQEQNNYNAKRESFIIANQKALSDISQFFEDKIDYFEWPLQSILLSLSSLFSTISSSHDQNSHFIQQTPPYYNPVIEFLGQSTTIPSIDDSPVTSNPSSGGSSGGLNNNVTNNVQRPSPPQSNGAPPPRPVSSAPQPYQPQPQQVGSYQQPNQYQQPSPPQQQQYGEYEQQQQQPPQQYRPPQPLRQPSPPNQQQVPSRPAPPPGAKSMYPSPQQYGGGAAPQQQQQQAPPRPVGGIPSPFGKPPGGAAPQQYQPPQQYAPPQQYQPPQQYAPPQQQQQQAPPRPVSSTFKQGPTYPVPKPAGGVPQPSQQQMNQMGGFALNAARNPAVQQGAMNAARNPAVQQGATNAINSQGY
ncbi:hypothetical protein ACTFIR_001035 [Dictyostelium discoideum]